MNKPSFLSISVLPIFALTVIWSIFFYSTMGGTALATQRQDTPESILNYARGLNSPLVLINFWASWCEPCKVELPALKSIQDKYSAQGLKVILISIDDPDEAPAAESYLRENNIDFTSFYKGTQSLRFVTQIYPMWTGAVPATLLMDRDLKILEAWEGDTTFEEFEQKVTRYLKGKT